MSYDDEGTILLKPHIKAIVSVDPDDPRRRLVGFEGPDEIMSSSPTPLPICVTYDLYVTQKRYIGHLNLEEYRAQLRAALQSVLDQHRALGNLDYRLGSGFVVSHARSLYGELI